MKNQQAGNQKRQREAASIWITRKPEIERLYVNGGWSQAQLAAHYGVSQQGIAKALKRLGLPTRSRGRAGAQNGRYLHGRDVRIYRTMVEKDACVTCGATKNLCVHHKDEDHFNNVPENLEVMCMSCHSSMHKTEWWRSRKGGQS